MSETDPSARAAIQAALRWHADMGVDAIVGGAPVNRLAPEPKSEQTPSSSRRRSAPPPAASTPSADAAPERARAIAAGCASLEELRDALERFDAGALKDGATQLVFADGNPRSGFMLIGEAPGREEDRLGKPFVGRSGQLLDRMLAAIGRSRDDERNGAYISNILPWRPPLNRKPDLGDIELCMPFLLRHIELVRPKLIVTLGGTASQHLLAQRDGIMSLRGRWFEVQAGELSIPVLPTLHPAFLLRTPAHKRRAWQDFLSVQLWLESHRD